MEHIRLIPGRYEEYIDKNIADCALYSSSADCRPLAFRIHARCRNSLAISVAYVWFALRHRPIKIDVDIHGYGAIAMLRFAILFTVRFTFRRLSTQLARPNRGVTISFHVRQASREYSYPIN